MCLQLDGGSTYYQRVVWKRNHDYYGTFPDSFICSELGGETLGSMQNKRDL